MHLVCSIRKIGKVFITSILDKDKQGVIELAKLEIKKSLTREAVISKAEVLDVAKAQAIRNEYIKDIR